MEVVNGPTAGRVRIPREGFQRAAQERCIERARLLNLPRRRPRSAKRRWVGRRSSVELHTEAPHKAAESDCDLSRASPGEKKKEELARTARRLGFHELQDQRSKWSLPTYCRRCALSESSIQICSGNSAETKRNWREVAAGTGGCTRPSCSSWQRFRWLVHRCSRRDALKRYAEKKISKPTMRMHLREWVLSFRRAP